MIVPVPMKSSTTKAESFLFVEYINKGKEAIFNTPIYVEGERQDTIVEVAMQYTDAYTENIYTFVNNINTEEGGTHLAGLKQALTRKHQRLCPQERSLKGQRGKPFR